MPDRRRSVPRPQDGGIPSRRPGYVFSQAVEDLQLRCLDYAECLHRAFQLVVGEKGISLLFGIKVMDHQNVIVVLNGCPDGIFLKVVFPEADTYEE